MSGYRKERIEKQIRMIVADTLLKDIKDPRIGFVTVTDASLNRDKTIAFVSVSVMGDDTDKKKSMIGLNSAKGYFQFKINKAIKMRNTPKLVFKLDTSIEDGAEMIDKLYHMEEEREKNIISDLEENENKDNIL